jgi:CRISPR/Cas system-associated endoribonuclease Cas2
MNKRNQVVGVEKEAKSVKRRYIFEQAILATLQLGMMVGLAVFMPNSMRILKLLGWTPTKRDPKYTFGSALDRLEQKGLVIKNEEKQSYRITIKGKLFLWKLESKYLAIEKPKRWDKRWRLIIFDIKEKDRFQRDAVRVMLQNIGCIHLQNSVWVYPYDCEEAIALLKANHEIGQEVLYIIAEKIEEDQWLRKYFNL